MIDCPTCLACEHASDESKDALLRWTHLKLDQARDALFPTQVELARAKDRIRELEDIVSRQQRVILKANGRRKTA